MEVHWLGREAVVLYTMISFYGFQEKAPGVTESKQSAILFIWINRLYSKFPENCQI